MAYDYREKTELLTPSSEHKGYYVCPNCQKNKFGIDENGAASCLTGGCKSDEIRKAIDRLEGKPDWKSKKIERSVPPAWVKPVRAAKTTEYFYPGRDGQPLVRVTRKDYGNGKKTFPQSHWNGQIWLNGNPDEVKCQVPIYRYKDVQEAIASDQQIYWVEGEETADDLWAIGIAATTSIGGAGKSRAYGNYSQDLVGAQLILCPDRDDSGIKHMAEIAQDFNAQVAG